MMLHLCYVNIQCSCVIVLGSYVDVCRMECHSIQNLFLIYNFKYVINLFSLPIRPKIIPFAPTWSIMHP
jgi:hypothetical protein